MIESRKLVSMNIAIPSPGPGASYAQLKARRDAVEALAAARKRDVETVVTKALSSGRLSAIDSVKQMARAKIEAIRERVKIIKQLYGTNPKGMAKALAQIFKELKSAVQSFREANKQSMDATGEGVRAALSEDEQAAAQAESEAGPPPKSLYDETIQAAREQLGRDGFEFIDTVRGLAKALTDLLETARTQARARKRDDETDKTFEDADTAFKDLNEQLDGMSEEILRAAPAAGMRVSIAA